MKIARMGMLTKDSLFRKHINRRLLKVMSGQSSFLTENKLFFLPYSGYGGLAMEEDWKNEERRNKDF